MQVKIGDFGLACMEDLSLEGEASSSSSTPVSPISFLQDANSKTKLSNEHTKGVGTSLYASPEQLKGKVYDTKVIVYKRLNDGLLLQRKLKNTFFHKNKRLTCSA